MKKYFIFIVLLFISFIGIVNAKNGPFSTFADISINYSEGFVHVYNPIEEIDEIKGVSYDIETNTLTLDNVEYEYIEITAMGEDFKIKLIGINKINHGIKVIGEKYKTNLEITGTGSLMLGASDYWGECITLTYGILVIDDTVSLTIQNQSNSDENLISVYNDSNVDKLITIKSDGDVEIVNVSNIVDNYYYYGAYFTSFVHNAYILKKGTKYYAAELYSESFYNVYNRELKVLEYNEETIYYSDKLISSDKTLLNIEEEGYEIIKSNVDILESSKISDGHKMIDPDSNKIYFESNNIVYEFTDKSIFLHDLEYKYAVPTEIVKNTLNYVDNLKQSYIESHYLEINPSKYVILEGNNATYDSKNSLSFTINAPYSLFEDGGKVYVDDKEITDYTSKEGSTIITLNKTFLDTLEVGNHTIKVEFTNGAYATGEFTINEKKNNPKTGDSIISIISILVISLLVLIINKRHLMI